MVDRYKKPCFDSSVFIGGLNKEICNGIKRDVVFDWLWQQAKSGKFKVYISALTLAEVFKTKKRTGEAATAATGECLDEFLSLIEEDFVEIIEIDRQVGLDAHALCRKYGIWPADSIQLACALKAGCDVLIFWDTPLGRVAHDSIRIEEPSIYEKDMFTPTEVATAEEIEEYERSKPQAALAVALGISGGSDGHVEGEAASAPVQISEKEPVQAEAASGKPEEQEVEVGKEKRPDNS